MQFKVVSALVFVTFAAANIITPAGDNHGAQADHAAAATPAATTPAANTHTDGKIAPPSPGEPLPTVPGTKCKANLLCCKTTGLPNSSAVYPLLGPLGVSPSTVSGLCGVTCTPLSVGSSCPNKPVCCSDISADGYNVVLGCNPVDLSS